jgi:peptidoglycan/LPS O-acetylase OafA/YrhL
MILLFGGGKYYPFFLTMTHTWTANPEMSASYNGPSWSISDEMFFYVAYVGLVAPARWIRVLVVVAPIALALVMADHTDASCRMETPQARQARRNAAH